MTQTIPDPENRGNEVNVQTAMEDIALIRRIMNHAEINLRRLGWLFLIYGSAAFAFLVLQLILAFYTARVAGLQSAATLHIILYVLSNAVSIALFVLFMLKRRSIKKTESVYTMKLFDLWGVMLFAPVFLDLILVPVKQVVPALNVILGNTALSCMKIGAVCICVFFTGQYISSRPMKVIAAVLSVLFPALFFIPLPFYGTALNESASAIQAFSYCSSQASLVSLLLPFVYIGMGIYSLKKQRGSVYGDE